MFIFKISIFYEFLDIKTISTSFLLLNGIGYVWIIRVFLIIAILSPIYVSIVRGRSGAYATLVSLLILSLSSILSSLDINNKMTSHLFTDIIIPTLTYGAIFILGYKCLSMKNSEKTLTFILFSVLLISMATYTYINKNIILGPQDFKYPPTMYFASYSIAMTYITLCLLTLILKRRSDLPYIFNFISSNTIWIYLWHIPVVEYFKKTNSIDNFAIKYLIALIISITITYLQASIIKTTTKNKLIRNIFTG
ncbi:acyltransferase family protein [Klebsiella pneumoniae]|nr:acyltransferase family protein [Klebsiella pneumoniae]